jgi:transcription antitermination factor NusG
MNLEQNNFSENSSEFQESEQKEDIGFWYLAKATPFHEKSAIEWLKKTAKDEGCEDSIIEYFIPQVQKKLEDGEANSKNSKDNLKSFMIGYFAVKLNLTPILQKILYKIQRSLSSKYKIIIFQDRKMTNKELEQMKNSSKLVKMSELSLYQPGDEVTITHESFQNMVGTIASICERTGKASVILHILGRSVSVEVELGKLKKKK